MATLEVHFQDKLKQRIAARAVESGFGTIEAYVQALLLADVGEEQVVSDADLEDLLLRRLDSGPGIELTPQFVKQFKQRVHRRRQSRKIKS